MSEQSGARINAKFWFDPLCPYAWITSRWLLDVADQRDIDVDFRLMSLWVVDEHTQGQPDEHREWLDRTLAAIRVVAAAQQTEGRGVVPELYEAIGRRIHPAKRGRDDADLRLVLLEALDEVGLPATLAEFMDSDHYDEVLRTSTDEGWSLVGHDVGVPVLGVADWGVYGPIMTRIPRGEDAVAVWDATLLLGPRDEFTELKRTRTERPQFD
jgi:predicted DsbA family dithiol-disulfide isomerase